MEASRILLSTSLICFFAAAAAAADESNTTTAIPEKDDKCPVGEEIPCGRVIDVNGTVLRYERGNMTEHDSTMPSEDCYWTIRAPPGYNVSLETTCYYKVEGESNAEYSVCIRYDQVITCMNSGYLSAVNSHINEGKFTVYYKNGSTHALAFTTTFTFLKRAVATTNPPPTSTTSDGVSTVPNYVIIIALCTVFSKIL